MKTKPPTKEDGAACAQYDNEMWFTEVPHIAEKAREICLTKCPVQEECLEFALNNPRIATFGTWGGYGQKPLKRLRAA